MKVRFFANSWIRINQNLPTIGDKCSCRSIIVQEYVRVFAETAMEFIKYEGCKGLYDLGHFGMFLPCPGSGSLLYFQFAGVKKLATHLPQL